MTDIPPAELRRRRIDNWRFKTILTAGADRDAALNHLGLFAKYWEAGQVKTRLGRSIGVEAASELYLAFVKHLLQQLADTANYRTLCFWPPSRQMDFQQLLTQLGMGRQRWRLQAQADGDLGQRMKSFFDQSFAVVAEDQPPSAARHTVLIGSDSPDIPRQFVNDAFDWLENCDVVIGPCRDGGYYLIGMRHETQSIFDGIPWSSAAVLTETCRLLDELPVSYRLLPVWDDVDELADLRALADRLQGDTRQRQLLEVIRRVTDPSS